MWCRVTEPTRRWSWTRELDRSTDDPKALICGFVDVDGQFGRFGLAVELAVS